MHTMTIKSHVGEDGVLRLELPVTMRNVELDVVVVLSERSPTQRESVFFSAVLGSIDDPTFTRHDQGEAELRDPLP